MKKIITSGPDPAALSRVAGLGSIRVHSVCLWEYNIIDPTLVDLISNFHVPTC